MLNPIVIAYHLIWTAYGWWLPNDPRGSTSRTISSQVIAALGELHFGRKLLQPVSREIREFYEQARKVLCYPLLEFAAKEVEEIGWAFAEAIAAQRYTCYGCAIMADHVHVLIRKHKHMAEEMIDNLKEASRLRLSALGLRDPDHPVWVSCGGWKVFLDHPDEIRRTIPYIESNPRKIGLPSQQWPFVTEHDGWPLHPGHSENSPYVKALRAAGRYA